MTLIALLLFLGLYGVLLIGGMMGPRSRFLCGLLALVFNYGLRRLIFLGEESGASIELWYATLLVGDGIFLFLLLYSLLDRGIPVALSLIDLAVLALLGFSALLALGDPRAPVIAKLAYWKSHFFYTLVYFLVRWNALPGIRERRWLAWIVLIAVLVGLRQSLFGPAEFELAWIASGFSVLASEGVQGVVGASVLGNLDAGYIRPFSLFALGTNFGIFLVFVLALEFGEHADRWCVRFGTFDVASVLMRPLMLLLLLGMAITVSRFVWVAAALYLALVYVLASRNRGRRLARTMLAAGLFVCLSITAVNFSIVWAAVDSAFGRAFVIGTYLARLDAQREFLLHLVTNPTMLLVGDGFGVGSSAVSKFASASGIAALFHHHNYLFNLVEDGGVALAVLVVLPLVMASRARVSGPRHGRYLSALAFAWSLLLLSVFVGGLASDSTLLSLYWAAVGIAGAIASESSTPVGQNSSSGPDQFSRWHHLGGRG